MCIKMKAIYRHTDQVGWTDIYGQIETNIYLMQLKPFSEIYTYYVDMDPFFVAHIA